MSIIIKSPFKCNKVESDPMSYGLREQVKDGLVSLYNNMSILISGPRGIGKSSLGAQLQNVLEGDDRLIERCDLNIKMNNSICIFTACSQEDSLDKIVYNLISLLENKIENLKLNNYTFKQLSFEFNLGIVKSRINIEKEKNRLTPTTTAGIFVDAINKTLAYLNGCGINIMIDEIDQIHESVNFAHFIKVVHETLYRNDIENVTFIFAGQTGIYTRLIKEQPAFERIVKHIQLDALDLDNSRYILDAACSNCKVGLKIEPDAEKMILSIASGYPYTIHLIGHEAFNNLLDEYKKYPKNVMMIEKENVLFGINSILVNKKERYFGIIDALTLDEKMFIYSISTKSSRIIPMSYRLGELAEYYSIPRDTENKEDIERFTDFINSLENKQILKVIYLNGEKGMCFVKNCFVFLLPLVSL